MYSFLNDYSEGAHPKVLKALEKSNFVQTVGYGQDEYCQKAKEIIQKRIQDPTADVHFLVGGTQANMTLISHILKPYQAVIACDEGHINGHETGAVESTGHKILVRPHKDGKLTVDMIEDILSEHTDEHKVQPRMVYISQTTELGSYYTKEELEAIYACTQKNNLYLFLDGARLGSAIVQEDAPSFVDIAKNTDAFYIGGTKMGALFGEALVILNADIKKDFRYSIKQKGGMLAKGRLLGVQFCALLEDDLYEEIGRYENELAVMIKNAFEKSGYDIYVPSTTNQVFVDLPENILQQIEKEYMVARFVPLKDGRTRIRIVTSWATPRDVVEEFAKKISLLK